MNDWITHDGGPCPVPQNTLLSGARYWDGREFSAARGETTLPTASEYDWRYLIAYRLAQPEPAALPGACKHGKAAYARCIECEDEFANPESLARDMTKRERFALAAMQGLLAGPDLSMSPNEYARESVLMADALLAALEVKDGR